MPSTPLALRGQACRQNAAAYVRCRTFGWRPRARLTIARHVQAALVLLGAKVPGKEGEKKLLQLALLIQVARLVLINQTDGECEGVGHVARLALELSG